MDSFSNLEKKRKKEQSKFSKKGFKDTKVSPVPKSSPVIPAGGASVSAVVSALDRIKTLEEQGPGSVDLTVIETNINTLDSVVSSQGVRLTATEDTVDEVETVANTAAENIIALTAALPSYFTSARTRDLIFEILLEQGLISSVSPTLLPGQYGADFQYKKTWSDDFSNSGATTLFNRWHPITMIEGLHQAGNNNTPYLRWAANYSEPKKCAFIKDDALHMRAVVENTPNPYRKPYSWRGETLRPDLNVIKLAFLTTWDRVYDNDIGGHITDPNAPNRTWGPGTAFEFKVDFSNMRTQACRFSIYLLPAYENDSIAYSPDGTRGVENDLTEIDFLDGLENTTQSKVISGIAAGNTPSSSVNLEPIISGIDLTTGVHTVTLLWAKDRFVWYIDGVEIIRDTDARRIPQVPHYLVISREANSGIKPQRDDGVLDDGLDAFSDGTPEMPADVGIWAVPVYKEIGNLHNDSVKVLSFDSYSFVDNSSAGVGIGDDKSGISPTIISANPPTTWTTGQSFTFIWQANGRTVSDWYLEVGGARGCSDIGTAREDGAEISTTITIGKDYTGPINARLWFREDANSPWHWRDFGFSSGLQDYRTGTDGRIRVTTSDGTYIGSTPTVAGLGWDGVSQGRDGLYGSMTDYSDGIIPSDYVEGLVASTVGVVGQPPPAYTGTATLSAIPNPPGLTYSIYSPTQAEIFWPDVLGEDITVDKYELVFDGLIVARALTNSYLADGLTSGTYDFSIRLVRDDGTFGPALTGSFTI